MLYTLLVLHQIIWNNILQHILNNKSEKITKILCDNGARIEKIGEKIDSSGGDLQVICPSHFNWMEPFALAL